MKKIRICAVQSKVNERFDKNITKVEHFFKKANSKDCDIVCFPEVFLTGGLYKKEYDPEIPFLSKKLFSKLSENYRLYSIMGSVIEKIGDNLYNISYLFNDTGSILGTYKKNHLVQKSEAQYLKSGMNISVFRTKIGNIGIQICRDLLYPELTRKLMIKNADIIFCPSFWCSKSSSYDRIYNDKYFKNKLPTEVDSLVSARAIESETAFVYVNAAGTFNHDGQKNILLGRTQIAVPFYGTIAKLNHNKEGILIKEIDLNIVKDAKKIYDIESDLKGYYKNK